MPRRLCNLMEKICRFDNLNLAFLRAIRGKAGFKPVADFRKDYDRNISDLGRRLLDGTFRFGNYHFFTIRDPKERLICAADFKERVAFQAMMLVCHQKFEDHQIDESFASRRGKGTYAAIDLAHRYAKKYIWFVKLDVRKYFDSINHEILYKMLCRLFKDKVLLQYFHQIISSYSSQQGKGLPIGNLTSQYFANHYLTYADRYLKETLKAPAIVRYMDDTLIFANDKDALLSIVAQYESFLNEILDLQIHTPIVNRTHFGVPFLGYVVFPGRIHLAHRSRRRFRRRLQTLERKFYLHGIAERELSFRVQCLYAFVNHADAENYKREIILSGHK